MDTIDENINGVTPRRHPANKEYNKSDTYFSRSPSPRTESPTLTDKKLSSLFSRYKPWLMWWNSDEWWPCWIGFIFFGCVVSAVHHGIPEPTFLLWDHNPFLTFASTGNYGLIVIFFAMGILLWIAMASIRAKGWQGYPLGYLVVFLLSLISKMLAANVQLKKASLGDSIWAIILGCVLRNLIALKRSAQQLPPWLKVAQQTELYIAVSLVLLCIDISVLRPLAPRALFVSWLDTPTLFMVVAFFGWRLLRIDMQTAIIMSGATFICGSSAAIALGASMGVPHKTEMPIAIISIFTIPSIIALPYVARSMNFNPDVSGAWFGGCVDSTGAVIAAASIYGDKEAVNTSAVVKMMQNILIGPISVMMAWGWTRYELRTADKYEQEPLRRDDHLVAELNETTDVSLEEIGATKTPISKLRKAEKPYILLWKRFPKFVLGFIITAVMFNTAVSGDPEVRTTVNNFCFYISEWFSTLSFVSIGLGLHLNDMKKNLRDLGKLCTLYVVAQLVDIIITAVLAFVAFTYM